MKKYLQTSYKEKRMFIWTLVITVLALAFFWSGPAPLGAPGAINRLEPVELGGVKQWISIRATNARAPVLLFLHGGPGSANLAKLRQQVPELEQHFVVVQWDQRGAGRSSWPGFDYNSLSIPQMVADAHELVLYLKAQFGVEKITLLGFSWGTAIGLELAGRYPQDIAAYIGVSQMVYPIEAERLSLEYVRRVARETNNAQASAELDKIDPAYQGEGWYSQLNTQRKWLLNFGGVYHTTSNYNHEIWMMLRAPEYSLYQFAWWPMASSRSLETLWPAVMTLNFFERTPRLPVPVYFFAGRHDYNTPTSLIERYYQQLDAPSGKALVWFENSAHDLFYDEPDKVLAEILKVTGR